MKTGKTSAATLGLVGGIVLGAWIGSELTTSRSETAPAPAAVTTQAVDELAAPTAPAKPQARDSSAAPAPCRSRCIWRRRRGAGTGSRSQTGDDDSGVGA